MAVRRIVSAADIGRVGDQLDQAIVSLIERGLEPVGVDRLREAARLLEEIHQQVQNDPSAHQPSRDREGAGDAWPPPRVAAALRGLVPRAARAGQLLDSAAAFYRGWLQVSPAPPEDYTAEGAWASAAVRSSAGGNLSLEA